MSAERQTRHLAHIAAVLSLIAALSASVVLVFLPVVAVQGEAVLYDNENALLTGKIRRDETLVKHQGWPVVTVLVIPVLGASLPFVAAPHGRRVRWMRMVSATFLSLFVLFTGFSIGLFYVPSAFAMIAAAALAMPCERAV